MASVREDDNPVVVFSDDEDDGVIVFSDDEGDEDHDDNDEYPINIRNMLAIKGFEPAEDSKDLLGDGMLWKVAVLREGEGEFGPEPGMWVTAHYKAWVIEPCFDSVMLEIVEDTTELGIPLKFKLGTADAYGHHAMQALEFGIWSMKKGEKSVFIAHHDMGFQNFRVCPVWSNLKIEIELLDFYDNLGMKDDFNDMIRYRVVPPKEEDVQPSKGALVKAEIIGEFDGRVFDSRTVDWLLGLEKLIDLPRGVVEGIKYFGRGEKSRLVLKGEYGFGQEGFPKFGIPPDATVTYTVSLLDFMDTPQFSSAEKIMYATKLNEAGKEALECSMFTSAQQHFSQALKIVKRDSMLLKVIPEDKDNAISEIQVSAATGIAKCCLADLKNTYIGTAISLLEEIWEEERQYLQANDQKFADLLRILTECHIAGKNFDEGKLTLEKLQNLNINSSETETLTKRYNAEVAESTAEEIERARRMFKFL